MALTGGTVLLGLNGLRQRLRDASPLARCASGAACITTAEFVVGCTVNRHYRMQVWDYSREWGNLRGQICPKYSLLWMALAAPIMLLKLPNRLSDRLPDRLPKRKPKSGGKFVQGFAR